MTHKHFTYEEVLDAAWEKTKEHFWFLLISLAICAAVTIVTMPALLIYQTATMLLSLAFMTMTLAIASNHAPKYDDLTKSLKSAKLVLNYFLATLIYAIIVIFGMIALILPGIYLMVRLQFYAFALIEHPAIGPIESLKKSWGLTEGNFWKLLGFMVLSAGIMLVSIIPLGLGLVFSIPILALSYAILYKKLSHATPHHHEEAAAEEKTPELIA